MKLQELISEAGLLKNMAASFNTGKTQGVKSLFNKDQDSASGSSSSKTHPVFSRFDDKTLKQIFINVLNQRPLTPKEIQILTYLSKNL